MVKRISRGVRRRPEISEAAKLFAEALKLRKHREDAIDDDKSCPGRGRCSRCDHYEELVAKIANILGLRVDEVHPIDVGDIEPPPWWELNQIEAWEGARRLYVDLCAAAGVEPQRRLAMREFDEGQTIVRWIERRIPTPAGLSGSGVPLRLRGWQRDIVRRIYASQGKKIRSTASIQAYLEWQNALSRYGVTQLATDAFFRLAREIEANQFLDNEGFDRALERLHRAAYPVAATRPPRLTAGEIETILE